MLQPNVYAPIALQRRWRSEGEGLKLCVDGDRWGAVRIRGTLIFMFLYLSKTVEIS